MSMPDEKTIWTVGHSNHALEHFLRMLSEASITQLADVRRFPGSRRQPQFQQADLETALAQAGIGYRHFPELGGRRSSRMPNSPNTAWRVQSFNAYADHMQTAAFLTALGELEDWALVATTAMMCSEAVPWRCHRRLIADALLVRHWKVWDIFAPGRVKPHELTEFAEVHGETLVYPAAELRDELD